MSQLLNRHKNNRKLTTLVENRTTYSAEYAELNIYETHAFAEKVALIFDFPIIASMLTGKKIMHLDGIPSFDFFPGESVVMPKKKEMIKTISFSQLLCFLLRSHFNKIII